MQVGRYELVKRLDRGFLGPLWVMRFEHDGDSLLAMGRVLELDDEIGAEAREELSEAAWEALELQSEGVARCADVVFESDKFALIDDFIEGQPLSALFRLKSTQRVLFPVDVALRIAVDVLGAVSAIRQASAELGLAHCHGGLGPDTVLVGTDGKSRVVNPLVAGIATAYEPFRLRPERAPYVAPEQWRGEEADERTDVYAVGCMLWELLANRRIHVTSPATIQRMVLDGKVPELREQEREGLNPPLRSAVEGALSFDPFARFESALAFAESLRGCGVKVASHAAVAQFVEELASAHLKSQRAATENSTMAHIADILRKQRPDEPKARRRSTKKHRVVSPSVEPAVGDTSESVISRDQSSQVNDSRHAAAGTPSNTRALKPEPATAEPAKAAKAQAVKAEVAQAEAAKAEEEAAQAETAKAEAAQAEAAKAEAAQAEAAKAEAAQAEAAQAEAAKAEAAKAEAAKAEAAQAEAAKAEAAKAEAAKATAAKPAAVFSAASRSAQTRADLPRVILQAPSHGPLRRTPDNQQEPRGSRAETSPRGTHRSQPPPRGPLPSYQPAPLAPRSQSSASRSQTLDIRTGPADGLAPLPPQPRRALANSNTTLLGIAPPSVSGEQRERLREHFGARKEPAGGPSDARSPSDVRSPPVRDDESLTRPFYALGDLEPVNVSEPEPVTLSSPPVEPVAAPPASLPPDYDDADEETRQWGAAEHALLARLRGVAPANSTEGAPPGPATTAAGGGGADASTVASASARAEMETEVTPRPVQAPSPFAPRKWPAVTWFFAGSALTLLVVVVVLLLRPIRQAEPPPVTPAAAPAVPPAAPESLRDVPRQRPAGPAQPTPSVSAASNSPPPSAQTAQAQAPSAATDEALAEEEPASAEPAGAVTPDEENPDEQPARAANVQQPAPKARPIRRPKSKPQKKAGSGFIPVDL